MVRRKEKSVGRLAVLRRRYISDKPFMFVLAAVVGVLAGTGAFILKHLIGYLSGWLTSGLRPEGANWLLLLLPVCGIMLTGIFCRYVLHKNLAHGVRQLMADLKNKDYRLSPRLTFTPMLASTLTLGFGGSAGSEGPIAYTGAAIGSNMARMFRLSPQMMMIMIGCGAGAGIAGIFKAPLGGALFTLEVLRMELTTMSVLVLLVCTITAAMTAFVLGGCTMDIPVGNIAAFDTSLIPCVILLGVFCGFYSLYYSYIMKMVERWLTKIRNPWVLNIAGGLILGGAVFVFPALYGEGYGVVGKVLNGDFAPVAADGMFSWGITDVRLLLLVVAGTLVVKCFATSATNSGGGVSGDFAPTLFAGCMAGFLFASLMNYVFGMMLPVEQFALFGMAGVMAGAIRAPLMALVLTSEMAAAFDYFLPLMMVSAISFGVVRLFTFDDYYRSRMDRNNGLLSKVSKQ